MAERIDYLTEQDTQSVAEHIYRYWLACNEIKYCDKVLDIACGLGYGTRLISDYCFSIKGVDYNKDIINENKNKYKQKNISFYKRNVDEYDIPDNECDVLVCFETIEHIKSPEKLTAQFTKFNKVILSTPIVPSKHTNSFHLHDFTEEQVLSWFPEDKWKVKWAKKQRDVYLVICAEKI